MTAKELLNRAQAYKAAVDANTDAGKRPDADINAGLYNYPLLMAADILLYGSHVVPVGKESIMIDKDELCEKIRTLYPDIGECGIDVNVSYDEEQKAWVVDLKKSGHELKTYLEYGDAEKCMGDVQCVSLGIEIAQLRANIERM